MTATALPMSGPRGWASVTDRPEDFPGVPHVWKHRRLSAGLKQATVIRRMLELAAVHGVTLAQPNSLKTMLSKWENGAPVPQAYEHLLCLIYGIRRPEDVSRRPVRYRNSAIYDRQLPAPAWSVPPLQPGLR